MRPKDHSSTDTAIDLDAALAVAKDAAYAAGRVLLSYYASEYEILKKAEGHPVTTADLEANTLLHDRLIGAFPQAGWLSEESRDNPERLNNEWVWVVDPLDGTKEFIEGIDEFAVSIGLVRGHEPVLAVTYNPAADIRVSSIKGSGTFANDLPVTLTSRTVLAGAVTLASRSETRRGLFKPYERLLDVRPTGSIAHKLAQFASGQSDVTFSLAPKNEWDICAGVMLARESGATVTDLDGKPFVFNQRDTLRNGVIAASPALFPALFELIKKRTMGP